VDKKLFVRLVIPGVIGGVLGVYILIHLPGEQIRPFVALYLLMMGIVILWRARKRIREKKAARHIVPLAAFGGFCDAIGGGGWGPIVTSSIVAGGHEPRVTIGSVNAAEFFVTIAHVLAFILSIQTFHWQIIVGLLIGGVAAAPLAAYLCNKVPARILMIAVGVLIIILSVRTIYLAYPEIYILSW
jgi:uncharacterized membrane protein YfcA